MTTAAFIFMLVSVTTVVGLVVWCYYRVLTTPRRPVSGSDSDN